MAFVAASTVSSYENCSRIYDKYVYKEVIKIVDNAVSDAKSSAEEQLRKTIDEEIENISDNAFGETDLIKEGVHSILGEDFQTVKDIVPEIYSFFNVDIETILTNEIVSSKIRIIADKYSAVTTEEINRRLPLGLKIKEDAVKEIMTDSNAIEAVIYDVFGIGSSYHNTQTISEYIEQKLLRPTLLRIIGMVLWAVVFSAVSIVLKIVVRMILLIRKAPPIKAVDSLLGAVLGFVGGGCCVFVLTMAAVLIIRSTGGIDYINDELISQTVIFKPIYMTVNSLTPDFL